MLMYMSELSLTGAVISQSLSISGDSILRSRQTTTTTSHCCDVQCTVVTCVLCNIIVVAATA